MEEVLVRRSGDGRLAKGAFDRERLVRDVTNGVLKRMTEQEVAIVVEDAIRDLEVRLEQFVEALSDQEQAERPGYQYAVLDGVIREAIEIRLRRYRQRMAHVLYALSTLGRVDREGRSGFPDAPAVLQWMNEDRNYPDLQLGAIPIPRSVPTDKWWPPDEAPLPEYVIKRDRTRRRHFGLEQFTASIQRAMIGRPEADQTAQLVAQWVLWGLAGQQEVLSSQLAVGVMDCLRRVDDIAYLRWAAVAKNTQSVTEFRQEALALVTHPSVRLRFDAEGMPRLRGRDSRSAPPAAAR